MHFNKRVGKQLYFSFKALELLFLHEQRCASVCTPVSPTRIIIWDQVVCSRSDFKKPTETFNVFSPLQSTLRYTHIQARSSLRLCVCLSHQALNTLPALSFVSTYASALPLGQQPSA